MAFQSPAHSNANALQSMILTKILGKPKSRAAVVSQPEVMDAREFSELVRTWIDLEHLKREIRGIPRLKPAEIGASIRRAKEQLMLPHEPVEIDLTTAVAGS